MLQYRGVGLLGQEVVSVTNTTESLVSIYNEYYEWQLDPIFGRLSIFVDGKKVDIVDIGHRLDLHLSPGSHIFRVKHWKWLMSPKLEINLSPGENVTLYTGIDQTQSLARRLALAYFKPRNLFYLRVGSPLSFTPTSMGNHHLNENPRVRAFRRMSTVSGLLSFIGFLIIFLNAKSAFGIGIGALIALVGMVIAGLNFRNR
jgi:hypothetical protein